MKKIVRKGADMSISTSRQKQSNGKPKGKEVAHTARTRVDDLPENPAYVSVNGGMTKSLGNYESVKLGVSVSIPCGVTDKAISDAYHRASCLVEEMMETEYDRVVGE